MSRSSSTVIVQKVTNVNIFEGQVNSAGKSIGMTPVKPGTSISDAAQQFEQAMNDKLVASFKTVYGVDLSQNVDNGYMGPIQNIVPGNAPKCVVDQIAEDLDNWNLPTTTDLPKRMASTITQHLVNQGGVLSHTGGTLQVNSNENIVWMAYYATFDIENGEQGAIYVFGAALKF